MLIGPTQPTEFGNRFDPEIGGVALRRVDRPGFMTANLMETGELARSVVALLAMLGDNPTVDLRMARLDPVGGLTTLAPTPEAITAAFSQ